MEPIITHSFGASHNSGGIRATLFVQAPQEERDENNNIINIDDIEPGTVHLEGTDIGQAFVSFRESQHEHLVMTIGVYLSLLQFMKKHWLQVSACMDKRINILKKINNQKKSRKNISFNTQGSVTYQRWFDVCFLHYQKYSNNDIYPLQPFLHLQILNKSIKLDPDVFYAMSLEFDKILDQLTQAGYKYEGPVSFLPQ